VENPDGAQHGLKALYVDGRPVPGNLIPAQPAGNTVRVRAVMG
jgi:hypothetical protein